MRSSSFARNFDYSPERRILARRTRRSRRILWRLKNGHMHVRTAILNEKSFSKICCLKDRYSGDAVPNSNPNGAHFRLIRSFQSFYDPGNNPFEIR
jgi:hypothetical protein